MVFPVWFSKHVNYPFLRMMKPTLRLKRTIADLVRAERLTTQELQDLQVRRLSSLIKHAWQNCDYYREGISDSEIKDGNLRSMADLQSLPILTKQDIQKNRQRLIAGNFAKTDLLPNHTGGSTGDPLHFFNDKGARLLHRSARAYRGDMMCGWDFGKRTIRLWGAGVDVGKSRSFKARVHGWLTNDMLLDCACLDDQIISEHLKCMQKFRPQIVVAYATLAYMFAKKILGGAFDIRPEAVVVTSETLTQPHRETIEEAFGCKVFNRYGCREVGLVACECEQHIGLHVGMDETLLEVVDDQGKPVAPGTPGRILITDLFNYGMPFIRYEIKDMGVLSDQSCPCGRNTPLLKEVLGRESDVIRLPSGRRIACLAMMCGFAKELPGIANLQLVRKGQTEFVMRILKGEAYKDSELEYIKEKIPTFFGDDVVFSYDFVDEIKRLPSGKYQFLISDLPADGLT